MSDGTYRGRKMLSGHRYPRVYWPDHPLSHDSCGFVYVHRAEWFRHHGKIPNGFVVHHIDENPKNWNINNLKVLRQDEHSRLHHDISEVVSLECDGCERRFTRKKSETNNNKDGGHYCSQECFKKSSERVDWPGTDTLVKMCNEDSVNAVGKQLGVSFNAVKKRLKVRNRYGDVV